MAKLEPALPVKLLVAVLYREAAAWSEALSALRALWGEIDFEGHDHAFDLTDYYEAEMGSGLWRRLLSFGHLVPPENLGAAKLRCNQLEDELAGPAGRRVNLDVGYLDNGKIVLASVKAAAHKIHLGAGVYADLCGRYGHGHYQPFEWTFPDFRDGRYDTELGAIRATYLRQLKTSRPKR